MIKKEKLILHLDIEGRMLRHFGTVINGFDEIDIFVSDNYGDKKFQLKKHYRESHVSNYYRARLNKIIKLRQGMLYKSCDDLWRTLRVFYRSVILFFVD